MAELILGGARSGKSALAEARATADSSPVIYVATALSGDEEMARRIAAHRARRPAAWGLAEEPLHLAACLRALAAPDTCLLVDCLTLWLSNLCFSGEAAAQAESGKTVHCPLLNDEIAALVAAVPALPGRLILVSNEVGWGGVPMSPLARFFADVQGRLNQQIAAVCTRVTLVAAGLPLELRPPL